MKRLLFLLFLLPALVHGQTDVVQLKKNGGVLKTYAPGDYFNIETIYQQTIDGNITMIRNDSIFINGMPFHYKEISLVRDPRVKHNYATNGTILMIAGGGVLLLGAVNGLYRGDPAKDWYTTTSYVTAGALLLGGFLLTKAQVKKYPLGKKYTLDYLQIDPNKK